jgi:predicted PhzF superfamily epimerase YddE/YHI9
MNLPLYQVDAFTRRLFGGNPAAVVVLDEWLEDELLQAIAAENNLSETSFVIPAADVCPLRWFTPTVEVDLCGHATLAAAHVLFRHHFPDRDRIVFRTRSGDLAVARSGDLLVLDFPARPGRRIPVDAALVDALGARPMEAYLARDLLAVFETEQEVRAFQPDFQRIASLDALALIITAPGSQADFVSRFFAPAAGVPEDPVTGSAHCTLIPYWAERLGRTTLTARQLSPRGGELHCELRGDRVLIGGSAVEYLRGEIAVERTGLTG